MGAYVERSIGGAGTGKTRQVLENLTRAKQELGLSVDQIGFCTFTRAGRAEISERAAGEWGVPVEALTKTGWFRTAHSIAYRQMEINSDQLITDDEWLCKAMDVQVCTQIDGRGERRYLAAEGGDFTVAHSLAVWDVARNRMCSVVKILERQRACGEATPSDAAVKMTIEKYEQQKRLGGKLDFTDMISRFAGVKFSVNGAEEVDPEGEVPDLRVLAIDEAQDSSPLVDKVCRRLAASPRMERIWLCGDPYQCQPAGTPVLTMSGYKNIEDLDPATDRLLAFSRKDGRFYGANGFEIASRDVDSSSLIEITLSDGTKHVSTDSHKWVVRTRKKKAAFAVYLMSQGSRWRVGTVQMFSSKPDEKNGSFRLKMRMNKEQANRAWVLKVFETDREARCYEQIFSYKYGIPQTVFRPVTGRGCNLDKWFIENVFDTLGDLTTNGQRCLSDHSLAEEFAFCEKADRCKNGEKASRLVRAVNLLPGIHFVPKIVDATQSVYRLRCEWVEVVSCRRLPPGEAVRVWSMNVHKHHTYVTANGVVTGNSIHSFAGGDYRLFLAWDAHESIMPKSYRCPSRILSLGEQCLREMRQGYRNRKIMPSQDGGEVDTCCHPTDSLRGIKANDSVLILGRCAFALKNYEDELKAKYLPYTWVDKTQATKTLSGYSALWALEHREAVHASEWAAAIEMLAVSQEGVPLLKRGEKSAWKRGERSNVDVILPNQRFMESAGMEPALMELIFSGKWTEAIESKSQDRAKTWHKTATLHGVDVACNPPIGLSTIHSAKGLEADTVILSDQSSRATENSRVSLSDIYDEECRVAYVAVTRARQRLVVVHEATPYRMELPV
jgi:DNA helicase-2/ATP-dependent DNA helicase PcrA